MADNTTLPTSDGKGDTLRTEDRTTFKTPVSLIDVGGTAGESLIGDSGVSMPVRGLGTAGSAATGVITIQGIASMTAVAVSDNSGSLTVDAPVGTPVFVRLSDGASAITTLPVSLASVPSHAVTNAGTFAVQADITGGGLGVVDAPIYTRLSDGASPITTLPVSLASVPSHAVTNAGTFAVQVDGAALTALQLIDNSIYVDDADWTATSSSHTLIGGVYQSTPGTITDGDTGPLRVDENGSLRVAIVSGAGSGGTASTDDADFTAKSTSGTPVMGVYQTSVDNVTDTDLGIVRITQKRAMHVTLYDSSGVELAVGGGTQYAVDAALGSTPTGTLAIAIRDDALSSLTPVEGDAVGLRVGSTGALWVQSDDFDSLNAAIAGINAAFAEPANVLYAGVVRKDTAASIVNADGDTTVLQVDASGSLRVTSTDPKADDADFSAGTTTGTPAMGVYESTPSSITDGDLGIVGLTQTRAMRCSVEGTVTVGSHAVTNAGTFAVQAACTNAGTFAVQVDGAALTALQLIDNPVVVDDAAFTPATTSVMMAGFTFDDSTPDTVNEGDAGAARMSANRCVYVNIRDNAGNERGLNIDASGYLTANINGTVTVGSHAVTNAGTFAVQVDGSALTALQLIDNCIFTDDAAYTPGSSGVAVIGAQCDDSSTDSVDEGDAGALRMTAARQLLTVIQPHTTGGCSIFRSIDIDESEEEIKASAGMIYGIHCMNLTAALLYLKFYNLTAGNCTVGTSTPVLTFPVPGNGDTDGAGFTFNLPQGIAFDTAISVACTTGVADADTGAPAANACVVNVFYK